MLVPIRAALRSAVPERAVDAIRSLRFDRAAARYRAVAGLPTPSEARGGRRRLTVLVWPSGLSYPDADYLPATSRLLAACGFRVAYHPGTPHDLALAYKDATRWDEPVPTDRPVLNDRCRDISKSRVDAVWTEVAGADGVHGVPTLLDPRAHAGPALRKHDDNSRGERVVVELPAEPVPDHVFQRLLVAPDGDGSRTEYRVPVYGGRIPLVILRTKLRGEPVASKGFTNVRVAPPHEAFSEDELRRLGRFATAFGADYAELDVLRGTDGVAHVIDVNNTPFSPRVPVPADSAPLIGPMAEAFAELCYEAAGE